MSIGSVVLVVVVLVHDSSHTTTLCLPCVSIRARSSGKVGVSGCDSCTIVTVDILIIVIYVSWVKGHTTATKVDESPALAQ